MKLLIILLAAVGGLYRLLLTVEQLRSANNPTPENVADIYDAQTYIKWKKYNAEHSRLGIVFCMLSTLVTCALLFTNAFAAFASLFPEGVFWQLFAVVLLEALVSFVLGIPESYISNMIIEQKYGFNRTTGKTFVADLIRDLIMNLILSTVLASIVMLCHLWLGDYMAILCAAALVGFSLLITFLYPFFSRIGNKFTPLEAGELRDRLMHLLTSHGYTVRAIEVMDASRRTTKQNAYFTGFGKMKTIVLYDNLVNAMTPDEICAVFAHELGHGLHKDTLKLQLLNVCNLTLMAVLAWLLVSTEALHTAFGFAEINYGFGGTLLGVVLGLTTPFTGMIVNAFSRKFEFAADRQAVKEGYGEAMIPALKKLARDNFAHLAPSKLHVVLEYSHPPIDKRIAAIEAEIAKKNG